MRRQEDELPACVCRDSWTSPDDGGSCGSLQQGCPNVPCDGDSDNWCVVANSPCREEQAPPQDSW